jgi:hypothetical protein
MADHQDVPIHYPAVEGDSPGTGSDNFRTST